MFIAKFKEANVFKKLVDSIKDLVSDVNLDITYSGISMQAMDSSHVALVSLNLKYNCFEEFRCDKQMVLGLNIQHVAKILKCSGSEDTITLKVEDDTNQVVFIFENKDLRKISEFKLCLITLDSEHLGIPDSVYGSIIKMSSTEFTRIFKELFAMSETVYIQTSKTSIKFSFSTEICSGHVMLDQNTQTSQDSSEFCEIQVTLPVSQGFALKYLNLFCKGHSLAKTVNMYLSNESPLMIEYALDDYGYIRFYLAPRINDEK